jgi:hypothetical protein
MSSDDFDLNFRPATYWFETNGDYDALSRIKGTYRRSRAKEILEQGGQLPDPGEGDSFFAQSLSDSDREQLGRVHPAMMGGEYLPDVEDDSAEIVRQELESVMGDVISIRATRSGTRINYSIVDEHGIQYEISPKSSKEPLTMRQLIRMIDGVRSEDGWIGLTVSFREYVLGLEGTPEKHVDFVTVSSTFYPQLEAYYKEQARDWLKKAKATRK